MLKKLQPVVFLISLGVLLFTDFLFYLNRAFPKSVFFLREILIVFVVLNSLPLFKRFEWFKSNLITTKLKTLYLLVLSLFIVWLFFSVTLNPFGQTWLFASLPVFIGGMGITLFIAALLAGVLLVLRDLILFKRRRFSERIFNLLLAVVALQIVHATLDNRGLGIQFGNEIFLFLVIVLIVVNSLRNSWVNYLDKNQKLKCTGLGAPLVAASIIFMIFVASQPIMTDYSVALSTFIQSTALFLCTYVGLGFLSLILHLPTASLFDRKIREIQSFQELSKSASAMLDSNQLLKMISDKTAAVMKSDVLWFEILHPESGELNVIRADHLDDSDASKPVSSKNGLSNWIIENRKSVLINEVSRDPRTESLNGMHHKLGSLLAAPLISQKGVIGVLYSGKRDVFAFDEEDRELLQSFANQATISLENARLFNELLEKERFEQELKIAHEAQQKLLCRNMPNIPSLEIDAISIAANEVGGDYYDFFELKDGKLGIAVGDVSGKGAKAAFYMAELKGVIESIARIYTSPKDVMVHINDTLCRNLDRQTFITLIYSVFDMRKRELVFTRAGHCPLIYHSTGQTDCELYEPPGLGIGLDNSHRFADVLREQRIKLQKEDLFVFYTDGVTEARNVYDEEYKESRLRDSVVRSSKQTARQIKDTLVEDVTKFVGSSKYHDDFTFVVAKVQ